MGEITAETTPAASAAPAASPLSFSAILDATLEQFVSARWPAALVSHKETIIGWIGEKISATEQKIAGDITASEKKIDQETTAKIKENITASETKTDGKIKAKFDEARSNAEKLIGEKIFTSEKHTDEKIKKIDQKIAANETKTDDRFKSTDQKITASEKKIDDKIKSKVDEKISTLKIDEKIEAKINEKLGKALKDLELKLSTKIDQKIADIKIDEKINSKIDQKLGNALKDLETKLNQSVDKRLAALQKSLKDLEARIPTVPLPQPINPVDPPDTTKIKSAGVDWFGGVTNYDEVAQKLINAGMSMDDIKRLNPGKIADLFERKASISGNWNQIRFTEAAYLNYRASFTTRTPPPPIP